MHRRFLEPLGLTFPQYLVMLELLETSPGSVGKIGVKLGIDTGTIVPLLKRMEQSGLISKKRDLLDERRVLVEPARQLARLRPRLYLSESTHSPLGLGHDFL